MRRYLPVPILVAVICVPVSCVGMRGADQSPVAVTGDPVDEAVFEAVKLPVKHALAILLEGQESDPFSPNHDWSRWKPSMRPQPLPPKGGETQPHKVVMDGVSLLLPLPDGLTERRMGASIATFREPKTSNDAPLSVCIFKSAVNDMAFTLPDDLFGRHTLAQPKALAISEELHRLGAMPKFDLLVAIMLADAGGFDPRVALPKRIANLYLFANKLAYGNHPRAQYYEGHGVRALVTEPIEGWSQSTDGSGKPIGPRKYDTCIQAAFALRGVDKVFDVWFRAPGRESPKIEMRQVLQFLAGCALAPEG
ncbi:MAG: hypothetical protein ACYSU0_04110 [Planctomycetota bacterium]|jgi:hypothetical protein